MSQDATVIARHAFIKGDLKLDGPAVIAGRVEGSILGEEIEIAAEGHVEGDIHAAVIDIHGSVKGNITATRACRLGATASVNSELRAANLSIAEGATFIGQVVVGQPPENIETEAEVREEAAAIAAIGKTINRIESFAGEVESPVHTVHVAAPPPVAMPAAAGVGPSPVMQGPEIRVFPQSVQTMQRAPRIIKAR